MDYTTIPLQDTQALIQWLNDLYPERCPNPDHSEREIWMKAGERRVVRHLINKLNRAEDKVLKGE